MVELSTGDLRAVTGYAVACAADVLPLFEAAAPDDPRPRAALDAARAFVAGGARSLLQRPPRQPAGGGRAAPLPAGPGPGNRVTQLMSALDTLLRDGGT